MGRFRRRRKLKKFLIILCALAAGLLAAAEARFAVSRVSLIEQRPANALPQYVLWGTIPSERERFWPSFWLHRKEYKALIEAYYPVEIDVSLRVYWGGRFWYLSAEGKLWLSSLAENRLVDGGGADKRPVLAWGADRATPIDMANSEGNVFHSSLPLALISRWYAQINEARALRQIRAGGSEGGDARRAAYPLPPRHEGKRRAAAAARRGGALGRSRARGEKALRRARKYAAGHLHRLHHKDKILLRNTGAGEKEEKKAEGAKK